MNLDAIGEIIAQGLGGEPEEIVDAYENDYGGIEGQFFDRGLVYDYAIDDEGLTYQENRTDSDYVADYYEGRLEADGIRCDSENPYEFYLGYIGIERNDARKMNCQYGQCGGRCLRRGEKCRSNGVRSPGKNRTTGQKIARGAAIGAGVGLAGGAVLGGAYGRVAGKQLNEAVDETNKEYGQKERSEAERNRTKNLATAFGAGTGAVSGAATGALYGTAGTAAVLGAAHLLKNRKKRRKGRK